MVEGEKGMKISKKKAVVVLIIVAAIGCFFLIKHFLITDEARIKRVIYQGKAAIEKEDFEGALKHVSRDYQDAYGLNKMAIAAILKRVYAEFDNIAIEVEEMEVTIGEGKRGQAAFNTWVTFRSKEGIGYLVGSFEEPCRVVFTLAKEGGTWRVIKVEGITPEGVSL
jgi:hypothetical protein